MTIQQHVKENTYILDHIVAEFLNSSDKNKIEGIQWYKTAHMVAAQMAETFNIKLIKVVGVIAALSPNNHWDKNIIDAESLIAAYNSGMSYDQIFDEIKVSTFNPNKRKALNVLFDQGRTNVDNKISIEELIKPKKESGHKVLSFFNCIFAYNNTIDVCIDGHALSIYLGERITVNNSRSNMTPKQYAHIQEAYRLATDKINEITKNKREYIPMEIQAITWLAYRERHNL